MSFFIGRSRLRQLVFQLKAWKGTDYEIIERELGILSGVHTPGLDTESGKVYVPYYPEHVSVDAVQQKLKTLGFTWTDLQDEDRSAGFTMEMNGWGLTLLVVILLGIVIWATVIR